MMMSLDSPDLIAIGMEADAVRRRLHPEGVVSYVIEPNTGGPDPAKLDEWIAFHRNAHKQGLRTTAAMTFEHLEVVRKIQEETGGFIAFTPLIREDATAVEYLKTLALSRIYLDNIENIQSSWATVGLKTCQIALRFGANDVGNLSTGAATEEDIRRIIRDAGFVPKQRDTLYRTYFLN